jgi:ABC-type amino acid transport system permease subunit
MEWLQTVFEFLSNVHWMRVIITVLATAVGVVAGIWFPARMLENYTNQPAARYIWYVLGTGAMVLIYISMYGYGLFWELYLESDLREELQPAVQALIGL